MSVLADLLNTGNDFARCGELHRAEAYFRKALAQEPDCPEALCNLGNALRDSGRLEEAAAFLERALSLRSALPAASINLAAVREEQGALEIAERHLRRAINQSPEMALAHNNLGSVLQKQGRSTEALRQLRRALRLDPELAETHHNLGVVLDRLERPHEAIASYREALRLKPCFADAHFDLGLTLLSLGNFREGWAEYRWRRQTRRQANRNWNRPEWDGSPLHGQTLLVHAEQGLGDTIQFLRYVPIIPDANIVVEAPGSLVGLMDRLPRSLTVVPCGATLPDFDLHVALLDLPGILRTTLENIPCKVPYLRIREPERVEFWRSATSSTRSPRVGLCWAGSTWNSNDRTRSMRLADLSRLKKSSDVRFISLQKGPAAQDLVSAAFRIPDPLRDTSDIQDTAALILSLDLVISVDTMVTHLAGALGKPVWTLLSFASDWRWFRHREDSPWYPTMRLFRQPRPGDWSAVLERVAQELEETRLCPPSID